MPELVKSKNSKKDKPKKAKVPEDNVPADDGAIEKATKKKAKASESEEPPKEKKAKKDKKRKSVDPEEDEGENDDEDGAKGKKPDAPAVEKSSKKDGKEKKAKKSKTEKASSGAKDADFAKGGKSQKKTGTWQYVEHEELKAMSEASIQSFLDDNSVTLMGTGEGIYRPIIKFAHAGFPKELSSELEAFPKPTCIQSIAWPGVLSGRDLVGIAATGSGKTIAFALPSMIHIRNRQVSSGSVFHGTKFPQVLVLSPTRELAIQIQETYEKFGGSIGIRSTCVYGGVNKWEQKKVLNNGVGVIVATPGRLIDLIEDEDGSCDLSDVSFLVLDEADRMLDLGFEEAIKKIVARIKPKSERQTVMFSATWPSAIQKIASQYLNEPIRVTVGSTDLAANVNIEQRVEVLDPQGKDRRLVDLLRDYHKSRKNRVLVFALYKKEAARLEQYLQRQGWKVASIHGDLSQQQRTDAITKFKDGSMPLLVATDVAARGIDVNDVEYVINYTYPLTTEEYCHRIGRTGRAGKKGIAHTFFTVQDKAHSGALINVLKQANQKVPAELMKFGTTVKKKADPNYGAFVKDVDMNAKGTKIVFGDDD